MSDCLNYSDKILIGINDIFYYEFSSKKDRFSTL